MDDRNEIMDAETVETARETETETNDTNYAITAEKADGTLDYDPAEWSKPPKKDPKTGRFIAGTGGSTKGGRPKGSKDRVSKAMVDLATELVANRGRELFHEMADRDPAQALALVSKIISPEELRAVYAEERAVENSAPQDVTIRLVSSPNSRLSNDRSERLEAPVQRIAASPDDIAGVVSDGSDTPTYEAREAADREAAEAERERRERLNAAVKAHGGVTGMPSREQRAAGQTIDAGEDVI